MVKPEKNDEEFELGNTRIYGAVVEESDGEEVNKEGLYGTCKERHVFFPHKRTGKTAWE